MSGAEQALATLRDYVERSTHWREGGATRHDAIKIALPELMDYVRDIEIANKNWRESALSNTKQACAARATARIAISHLQAVLNKCRTHAEQQVADTAARDWLISIGSEPT